ncbi:MAG: 16S rRNA (guanine(527)-N(7))-methyltransferase RsmG [Kofleriaceae bacterium]|nr:16S rRNA (guanine(527)-N(7))-methyltransferase RsmG [Kofleriaceae bacterium]
MTQLVKTLEQLGLATTSATQLSTFAKLFSKWNASINLSAARTQPEIESHIVDSLHCVPHLSGARRAIDVGSGGGLPVVVAAICLPDTNFTALEPVHKKHAFLRTAARELKLGNLVPLAIRVEDVPMHDFDAASSRATFDLRAWILTGLSLVRAAGRVIGFEAIPRDDIPPPFERFPYSHEGRQRSIVVARKPAMD